MGEGDGDVGEDDGGVGEDRGDDDGPQRRLIRLQRIYNFLLFHDIILPVLYVYGLYFTHLYPFWD